MQAFLYQLDCMFGTAEDPKPGLFTAMIFHFDGYTATTHYEDKMTHNWSKDPFIRCAYTYPTLMPLEQRLEISKVWKQYDLLFCCCFVNFTMQPLNNKIFFCGEATVVDHELATLNGALESGLKAANLTLQSLKLKNKL